MSTVEITTQLTSIAQRIHDAAATANDAEWLLDLARTMWGSQAIRVSTGAPRTVVDVDIISNGSRDHVQPR